MTAQKGKDLLLKVDETGAGSFVTVAGIRSNQISFNAETVDVTTADSSGHWRQLLAGAGVKSCAVSGSGIFTDVSSDSTLRSVFFNDETPDFQLVVPDFGTVEGPFQVTALEYAGTYDGEATFDIALASAGALSFTAF